MAKMKILIDNGHGSNTPGKRSPDGKLREYAWNREIASRLEAELLKMGFDAERIVTEDSDISLTERCRRVNIRCAASNCIFISIHINAAGNGQWMNARGWSAWTSVGQTKGDKLADCLYQAAHEVLDPQGLRIREDWSDKDADWESNFTVLAKTKCPAALTENFFMDNKEDYQYLLSEKGKQSVIDIHIKGIKKYIESL